VTPDEIAKIPVVMTAVGAEVVYRAQHHAMVDILLDHSARSG
jgi:TRAP-type C4-dicarboxylate transport system permease small subunit